MSKIELPPEQAWKPVVGYEEHYSVSSDGEVFSHRAGRKLKPLVQPKTGYAMVWFSVDGLRERRSIHRVVAASWIGPAPDGHHVDHIDGNRLHNAVSNLRYLTPAENNRATAARGATARGERNGQSKLTDAQVAEIRRAKLSGGRYWGANQLAEKFGVTRCQVMRAASGSTFRHIPAPVRGYGYLAAAAIRNLIKESNNG